MTAGGGGERRDLKKKIVDGRQDREEDDDKLSEKSLWARIYNPEKWETEEGKNCHIR